MKKLHVFRFRLLMIRIENCVNGGCGPTDKKKYFKKPEIVVKYRSHSISSPIQYRLPIFQFPIP